MARVCVALNNIVDLISWGNHLGHVFIQLVALQFKHPCLGALLCTLRDTLHYGHWSSTQRILLIWLARNIRLSIDFYIKTNESDAFQNVFMALFFVSLSTKSLASIKEYEKDDNRNPNYPWANKLCFLIFLIYSNLYILLDFFLDQNQEKFIWGQFLLECEAPLKNEMSFFHIFT